MLHKARTFRFSAILMTMSVSFQPMGPADSDSIIEFLASNRFPFHVTATPQADEIRAGIEGGRLWSEDTQGYWIYQARQRLGMVALEDLQDNAPLFDLRLAECHRGQGLGAEILKSLTAFVFTSMPLILRFEGQTREDNIAMRKTFLRAGFVKEAHYRMGWPTEDGGHVASVAYAILRHDWESGTTTPLVWDDLKI